MRIDRSELFPAAVGFVVSAAVIAIVYVGVTSVYRILTPTDESLPGSVAMAVYFPDAGEGTGLRVYGEVLENGNPLAAGRARITVRRLNDALQQSVSVPVKNGTFDSSVQPAFGVFSRTDRLNVTTEVSKPDAAFFAEAETYLNAYPPLRPSSVRWTIAALVVTAIVFFWAFTGVATPGKNQAAIIFSYVVMLLFLALPFVSFYVLGRYQAVAQVAQDVAGSTPVGVLPAVPLNDSDGRTATDLEREWVLNIGGIVRTRDREATSNEEQRSQTMPIAPERGPEAQPSAVADAESPGPATDQSAAAGAGHDGPVGPPKEDRSESSGDSGPPEYVIEGGIVIPLYVLVLSIIGGAINMTRMLPIYQREAQTLVNPRQWLSAVGGTVLRRTPAAQSPLAARETGGTTDLKDSAQDGTAGASVTIITPPPNEGQAASSQVQVAVTQPGSARPEDSTGSASSVETTPGETEEAPNAAKTMTVTVAPVNKPKTPAELAAIWRQGLVTQHMYLLAAPFLAIAIFYLLDWLDMRKKALLVLASLSVGLTSDKIVSAVLSVVDPILDRADNGNRTKVDAQAKP